MRTIASAPPGYKFCFYCTFIFIVFIVPSSIQKNGAGKSNVSRITLYYSFKIFEITFQNTSFSLKGTVFFLLRPVNFLRGRHNRFTIAATFGATASTCLELFLDGEGEIFMVGGPPWAKGESGTSVPEMINPEYLWLVQLCLIVEMLSEIWKILLDYKSERNVTRQLDIACVLLFWEVKLFHVRFVTKKISLHEETIMPTTRKWEIQNSMFRTPVYCFSGLFKRSKHGSSYWGYIIAPAGISPRGEMPRRHPSNLRVY